jgi:hypothetical protein
MNLLIIDGGSISNFVMEKRMAHLKIIRVKKIRR